MSKLRLIRSLMLVKSPQWLTNIAYAGRLRLVDGRRIDAKAQAGWGVARSGPRDRRPQIIRDELA